MIGDSKWFQKSRLRWLKVGDRNSSFFHKVYKIRTSRERLKLLSYNGEQFQNPSTIKRAIFNHFHSFFKQGERANVSFRCSNLVKVKALDKDMLEEPFLEEEIWGVVQSCDANKAPRPDGFNLYFFMEFWSLIKSYIVMFFREFHTHGKQVRGLNAALLL